MIIVLFCVLDFVSRLMMKHRLKIIYYMCVNEYECSMLVCMHVFACVCIQVDEYARVCSVCGCPRAM